MTEQPNTTGQPIIYEGRVLEHNCYKCEKKIKPGNEVWIEYNTRTGAFTLDNLDEKDSQGWFPFGPECGPKVKTSLKAGKSGWKAQK